MSSLTLEMLRRAFEKLKDEPYRPNTPVAWVKSQQEIAALSELVQISREEAMVLGIPVIIDETVPSGVLRVKNVDGAIRDFPVR